VFVHESLYSGSHNFSAGLCKSYRHIALPRQYKHRLFSCRYFAVVSRVTNSENFCHKYLLVTNIFLAVIAANFHTGIEFEEKQSDFSCARQLQEVSVIHLRNTSTVIRGKSLTVDDSSIRQHVCWTEQVHC
jgi:hypothetical protein